MSQSKRVSRAGTSAPSPKRQRTVLTSEQKGEIYDFYLEFCEDQSRVSSASRKGKQSKKRHHNHSFVTDSYDSRPRTFETVRLSSGHYRSLQNHRDFSHFHSRNNKTALPGWEERTGSVLLKSGMTSS